MLQKTIKELESDLLEYQQAHAFGDIDKAEFERAEASFKKQIAARELVYIKQRAAKEADSLLAKGLIDRKAWIQTINMIGNAKSAAEIESIEFKAAA